MVKHRRSIVFAGLISTAILTNAPTARVTRAGETEIKTVSERMQGFVTAKEVAGAVTLVATPEGIVHLNATGFADVSGARPMKPDTIVWIASMSKPVTGTAVMMLADEGKLSADDPVEKYLPEFAKLKNAEGKPVKVTIKHLLTHTSGLEEISPAEAREAKTLADVIPLYVAKPVKFEPGTKWVYCQSSINTAARIVEVISGESFDKFLDRRLFGPLGMKDSTFYLNDEQLTRLSKSYRRSAEGNLDETPNVILYGKSASSRDRFPAANGGLFSTALDYAKFCRMILNGGEFDGKRYLSADAIKQMSMIHTGDLRTGFTDGNGWGLGWCVVRNPQGVTSKLAAGSFGHGGAYGTQAWIDPKAKRIYILMVQRANFGNGDASDVRRVFQEAAAAALDAK